MSLFEAIKLTIPEDQHHRLKGTVTESGGHYVSYYTGDNDMGPKVGIHRASAEYYSYEPGEEVSVYYLEPAHGEYADGPGWYVTGSARYPVDKVGEAVCEFLDRINGKPYNPNAGYTMDEVFIKKSK